MSKDPLKEYLDHADKEVLPAMEKSNLTIAVAPDKPDAKICLEIGAAVMFLSQKTKRYRQISSA